MSAEKDRLEAYRLRKSNWKHWGPYLSERSWGTVREDYSAGGTAWDFFPHDHARSKAYRWGEDGIGGICDRNQYLCFALAFWNGKDTILKERMFGLSGPEGNHGEDVKEIYYYSDSTPTHSYMKMLYKYPHGCFPYEQLVEENRKRGKTAVEFELVDTGIFADKRYFDCVIEYAKADENDILIRVIVHNRGPEPAPIHVLPTIWFRNTWSWGYPEGPMGDVTSRPELRLVNSGIVAEHPVLGDYVLYAEDTSRAKAEHLFTENETNALRLYGLQNRTPFVKDAFHRYVINSEKDAVNPGKLGTKACTHYSTLLEGETSWEIRLRLGRPGERAPFVKFDETFKLRLAEADEFYAALQKPGLTLDEKSVQRQAIAGLLWSKQLYYYDMEQWLDGDPGQAAPPPERKRGRNSGWRHLTNFDLISMPDKWEFPWYAAWDLGFHAIPLALVDGEFAKRQLELMTREWYMHPNGQLPAYEWAFDDVNPPVHAGAAWRVYKIDAKQTGVRDTRFLEGVFHKLLLNFTWWVNRKDAAGNNIFQGGFLGLDNIGVFDRSQPLPTGGRIDQADGTSWMAIFCLTMLKTALELAESNPVYQDLASKFLEHFLRVAHAMTNIGNAGHSLWDEQDGFFYDVLHLPDGTMTPMRVRSVVGLIPLIAVDTIEPGTLERFPDFRRRLKWFVKNRPHLVGNMARIDVPGVGKRRLTALVTKERLVRVLSRMFDESEFLSPYGIRSLSKYHEKNPLTVDCGSVVHSIQYEPGESTSGLFGGNSNWRGPIWIPMNFMLIEALQRYHHYYGDELSVEYPTGSGKMHSLNDIAHDLSHRVSNIVLTGAKGERPVYGGEKLFREDEYFQGHVLFHEYFHGDTGKGLGASHQTGWTGLIAKLIQRSGGLWDKFEA